MPSLDGGDGQHPSPSDGCGDRDLYDGLESNYLVCRKNTYVMVATHRSLECIDTQAVQSNLERRYDPPEGPWVR